MEMPTRQGVFRLWVWEGKRGQESVALVTPLLDPNREVMVRVHSECLTGDVFHSLTCDCGPQKELALKKIQEHGNGIFIYHRQEGRNMGLFKKVQSYNLMQEGMDTHEAVLSLAGHPDPREYSEVLTELDFLLKGQKSSLKLLTNNPYKALFLERHGYRVRVESLRAGASIHNASYTQAKTEKFLHNTVGYIPYTSVTLDRTDIENVQTMAEIVSSSHPLPGGRKLFFGVSLYPTAEELKDSKLIESLIQQLTQLHGVVLQLENTHLVLHLYYPLTRQAQRDLKRFLAKLSFDYSLQFRMPDNAPSGSRVDVDLIDALHGQHVIFQLQSEHFYLLEQRSFAGYFSSPNKFIMLDESFGHGIKEQINTTQEKILKLISLGLSRVSVAGGYGPDNVSHIHDLEDYFKIPISVDAESKLRTDGRLDPIKVREYLDFFFPAR